MRGTRETGNRAFPATLIRMSVGLEHVEDLWEDLKSGLDRVETGA